MVIHRSELKDCLSPQDIWSLLKPCVLLSYLNACVYTVAGAFDRSADMNINGCASFLFSSTETSCLYKRTRSTHHKNAPIQKTMKRK